MSSLGAISGGHSEHPPPLGSRERDNMEAGIDLFAAATVEAVAVKAPPTVVRPTPMTQFLKRTAFRGRTTPHRPISYR